MSTVLFSPSYSWRLRLFAQGFLQGLSHQQILPAIDWRCMIYCIFRSDIGERFALRIGIRS